MEPIDQPARCEDPPVRMKPADPLSVVRSNPVVGAFGRAVANAEELLPSTTNTWPRLEEAYGVDIAKSTNPSPLMSPTVETPRPLLEFAGPLNFSTPLPDVAR